MTTIHVFEEAGLGRAPFKLIDVYEKRGPLLISQEGGVSHWAGSPGQPMGVCAHCGTGIAQCCVIQDADGKTFEVGNQCVAKTGDKGLVDKAKRAINAKRTDARNKKMDERIQWARDNMAKAQAAWSLQPHPYKDYADRGKTLWDWAQWWMMNAGRAGRMEVVAKLEKTLGVVAA